MLWLKSFHLIFLVTWFVERRNEFPTLILIAVVILVVVKPF